MLKLIFNAFKCVFVQDFASDSTQGAELSMWLDD